MGEVLDLHIRVHDERVRKYWRENAKDLIRPSLQIEKLILMGMYVFEKLRRNQPVFINGESKLPPIDLYYREKILGLNIVECLRARILSDVQAHDIHETLSALAFDFQHPFVIEAVERGRERKEARTH